MDTLQIDRALDKVPGFLGAFPFNELPDKPSSDFSVIVNTDAGPGDHWLALVRMQDKIYFHDSYGRKPDNELFTLEFIKSMKDYISGDCVSNTKLIQQLMSNVCGFHCIYFILEIQKNSFDQVLSVFTKNLKKNDDIVVKYFNSL